MLLLLSLYVVFLFQDESIEMKSKANKKKAPFSFDDIFDPSLRPRGFDGTWLCKFNTLYY